MNRMHTLFSSAAALLSIALAACSSSEPAAAPSRPPIPAPATETDGGGTGPGVETGTDGGADCFDTTKTKPTETSHFLNQCNGTECFKFDNSTRIEGFKPGQALPPLN